MIACYSSLGNLKEIRLDILQRNPGTSIWTQTHPIFALCCPSQNIFLFTMTHYKTNHLFYQANINDANIDAYWYIFLVNTAEYICRGVEWCCYWENVNYENINAYWCIFPVNIVEYRFRGSGDAVIRIISMMQITMHIDADFELILLNNNAWGLGDSVIRGILMMQISMHIDAVVGWIFLVTLMQINTYYGCILMLISMHILIETPNKYATSSTNNDDY